MSNDVSYVIKVVDDFSANLKKFQTGITQVNQAATNSTQVLEKSAKSSKFFTQNLIDLGKAAGIYFGAQQIKNFGVGIFQARVEMDGLQASLAAIMPKFDKTKSGTQLAAEEIDYLREAANRMGISFQTAAPEYMKFLASSKQDLATTRKTFEAFSGLSRLYGLTPQRFGLVINALQQMQGKGRVMMEELKLQLGDSLPNAMNLFAEAAGVSSAEFYKLVEKGRVGSGILRMVAENIEKKFGKDMVVAAQTLGGRTAVLSNQWYYFKTVLSDLVAPALSGTITSLAKLSGDAADLFKAINDQSVFERLAPNLQLVAEAFRGISFVMQKMLEIGQKLTPIFNLIAMVGHGIRDFGAATTIAAQYGIGSAEVLAGGLWGGENTEQIVSEGKRKISVASDARAELKHQILYRQFNQNTPQVNITVNKAAPNTTIEVQSPKKAANVRTGNTVGGAD